MMTIASNKNFITCFIISFIIGTASFHGYSYFPIGTSAVISIGLILLFFHKRFIPSVLIGLLLGFIVAYLQIDKSQDVKDYTSEYIIDGVVSSIPQKTTHGYLQGYKIFHTNPLIPPIEGDISLLTHIEYEPGTDLLMSIRLVPNVQYYNPGAFNGNLKQRGKIDKIYSQSRDESSRWLPERLRYRLQKYFEINFPPEIGGLLSALLIGTNGGISDETLRNFSRTGLTHLLSISGSHFGLISVLIFGIFLFLIHSLPFTVLNRLTAYITPKKAAALLTLPIVFMYLFMSGLMVPAIRSFIMVSLLLWGYLLGRKRVLINSILFSAFIILMLEPQALFTVSFQLSFLAVLFIGLSLNKPYELKEPAQGGLIGFVDYIKEGFIVSIAAFFGTLPIVMYVFHSVPLISPISNLIVAPILCFIILPMAFFGSIIYLLTGFFPFPDVLSMITEIFIKFVGIFASIPYASIPVRQFPIIFVFMMYAGLLMFMFLHLRRIAIIILSITMIGLTIFYYTSVQKDSMVTFLSVGNGDAAVIETPDGRTIVMDTASTGRQVKNYLMYRGKDTIDAIILSHAELDHFGGLGLLLTFFDVREVLDNGHVLYCDSMLEFFRQRGITLRHLTAGDVIGVGQFLSMTVFNPFDIHRYAVSRKSDSDNNYSLTIKASFPKTSFLFTGDIETEAENSMLQFGDKLASTVLKVAHHGSRTSSEKIFLDYVSPVAAVISVSEINLFGHPSSEVLERLSGVTTTDSDVTNPNSGVAIYRTDKDGAVSFSDTPEGLRVRTYRSWDTSFNRRSWDDTHSSATTHIEIENIKRLFTVW